MDSFCWKCLSVFFGRLKRKTLSASMSFSAMASMRSRSLSSRLLHHHMDVQSWIFFNSKLEMREIAGMPLDEYGWIDSFWLQVGDAPDSSGAWYPRASGKSQTFLRCAKPKNATFAERQVWLKLPPLHPCAQLRSQLTDVFVYFFVGNILNWWCLQISEMKSSF